MEDLPAPPKPCDSEALGKTDGPTMPNLAQLILWSINAGILAFIASAGSRVFINLMLLAQYLINAPSVSKTSPLRTTSLPVPRSAVAERALENPLSPLFFAPVIETLLFLIVYKLLQRRGGRPFALVPFMAVLAVLSWAIHGATLQDIGQALGFAVLAIVYFCTARAHGLLWAYFATVVAHVAWNSMPYAIYFART